MSGLEARFIFNYNEAKKTAAQNSEAKSKKAKSTEQERARPRHMYHFKSSDAWNPNNFKTDIKAILACKEFTDLVRQLQYPAGVELLCTLRQNNEIDDNAPTEKIVRLLLTEFIRKDGELKGRQLQCNTNVFLARAEHCKFYKELSEGTLVKNSKIFASLHPTLKHPINAQGSLPEEDGFMRVQFEKEFQEDSGVEGIERRAKEKYGENPGQELMSFEARWTKEGKINFEFKLPLSGESVTNEDFAHLPCPVAKDRFNYDVHVLPVVSTPEQFFEAFDDAPQNWNTVYVDDELQGKLNDAYLKNNDVVVKERLIVVTVAHKDRKHLEVTYTVKESKPGDPTRIFNPVDEAKSLLQRSLVSGIKCQRDHNHNIKTCSYYHSKEKASDIIKEVRRGQKYIDADAKNDKNPTGFKDYMCRGYSWLWGNIDKNFAGKNYFRTDVAIVFNNNKKETGEWVVTHRRAAEMTERISTDGESVMVYEKKTETLEEGLKRSLNTVQGMYELLSDDPDLLDKLDCKYLTRATVRYPPPVPKAIPYCRFYGGRLSQLSNSLSFALAKTKEEADKLKVSLTSSKWGGVKRDTSGHTAKSFLRKLWGRRLGGSGGIKVSRTVITKLQTCLCSAT